MLKKIMVAGVLLMGVCAGSVRAQAATNSNKVDVVLSAQVLNSLTLVVANPAVAFGVVIPGTSNAAPLGQQVAVVSSWTLAAGNTVKLFAYFDTSTAAMTGTLTGALVPVSAFTGSVNSGATQAFTSTNPFGGAALALPMYSQTLTSLTAIGGRTDSIALTMNLTGVTSLAADNYTGTMHIQAQAL
jgi:hypothetical protein